MPKNYLIGRFYVVSMHSANM
uniref:Uncharacterized protein n=1 Tax=mine drainage metagenome TaxID=410659 RepID=E6Q901_9ZZZZ